MRAELDTLVPAGWWPTTEQLRTDEGCDHARELLRTLIAELRGGGSDARSVIDPAATFCANGNHHALITRHYGIKGGHPARHTTTVDDVLRTITANGGNMSLVTSYNGNAGYAKPTDEPIGTLTTVDRYALGHRNSTGGPEMTTPDTEYLRTLTSTGHQALIQSDPRGGRLKVSPADLRAAEELVPSACSRCFRPHDIAAGMAFPSDYDWDVRDERGKRRATVTSSAWPETQSPHPPHATSSPA